MSPVNYRPGALAAGLFTLIPLLSDAQCARWQQHVRCQLTVELDERTHRYHGTEKLTYANNGPDTLDVLYFHLYPNAFRPGSEMDVRSRTIPDPDPRVGSRIAALSPQDQGRLSCSAVDVDGMAARLEELGTILRVRPTRPVLPGAKAELVMTFEGQVPVQIRRSGRDNAEGVAYSMTQWYPKICAYDDRGWHNDPYVAREFYGEWGDFDLYVTLDSSFTVAATGVLQEPASIGHGYARVDPARRRIDRQGRLTWHFKADQVHDVAWAADRAFTQITAQVPEGPLLRFFFKDEPDLRPVWEQLPAYMVRSFQYMDTTYGHYPWPVYSFVQGGDGGMEYPMLTLISGKRRLGSLVGVSVHESIHSWFYGLLANDESHYPWMDEGFTEFAGEEVMRSLFGAKGAPHASAFANYVALVGRPDHEPMRLHADHYLTNRAYGITAYSIGEMFLQQLGCVVGDRELHRGLRNYYSACHFKHPRPEDLELALEKTTGLDLSWYFDEWLNTTRTVDHAVDTVVTAGDSTRIIIRRLGEMIMPVEVAVLWPDSEMTVLHIPTSLELGAKSADSEGYRFTVLPAWQWTDPTYSFALPVRSGPPLRVVLDPTQRLADIDRSNDAYPRREQEEGDEPSQ
ncbi:MAG: M1 family metallopeptidase [Flavobacteriales bacterium]|nr:M1 family metallopeptidase [Flavobacteriales bacterium]MCB9167911.1 M1 family metallopeptidase [Flavobacteriales bacterium]